MNDAGKRLFAHLTMHPRRGVDGRIRAGTPLRAELSSPTRSCAALLSRVDNRPRVPERGRLRISQSNNAPALDCLWWRQRYDTYARRHRITITGSALLCNNGVWRSSCNKAAEHRRYSLFDRWAQCGNGLPTARSSMYVSAGLRRGCIPEPRNG